MPPLGTLDLRWLWEVLAAGGLGLLIGLEREHARLDPQAHLPADPHAKGARTFCLIALFGYAAALLGEKAPALPVVALLSLAGLLGALHLRRHMAQRPEGGAEEAPAPPPPQTEDITTEVAALLTALLGMLVRDNLGVAVMLALMATTVLIVKPWMRGLVARLRRAELVGTLQLLVALLIVLPLMPDRTLEFVGPVEGVLNPRSIVLFVVLTAAVGYVGYFMIRILGPARGLSVTGLVGGLTSSTAVTLAMGEYSKADRRLGAPASLATLLACGVMAVRVEIITLVIYPPLGRVLAGPVGAMVAGYLLGSAALAFIPRLRGEGSGPREGDQAPRLALENPFELLPAIKFGVLYVLVLLFARVARTYLGVKGLYLAAMLAGLADVDSITLTSARMIQQGGEPLRVGAITIMVAVASNTFLKSLLAFTSGGRGYGVRVLAGQALALLCGALALVFI